MSIHFGVNFGVSEWKEGINSSNGRIIPWFAGLYFSNEVYEGKLLKRDFLEQCLEKCHSRGTI